MYRFLLPLLILGVVAPGCIKSHSDPAESPSQAGLYGRWQYVEYGYSIGGPMIWQPVDPPGGWIEFNTNGSLHTTIPDYSRFSRFDILDSARLELIPLIPAADSVLFGYRIDLPTGNLYLSPLDPICIEGCGAKFTWYPSKQ